MIDQVTSQLEDKQHRTRAKLLLQIPLQNGLNVLVGLLLTLGYKEQNPLWEQIRVVWNYDALAAITAGPPHTPLTPFLVLCELFKQS